MSHADYRRALNRSDLSQWVVHLVRPHAPITPNHLGHAGEILDSIFRESFIRPSQNDSITKYCPEGAACFYDAPPPVWPEIVRTNPNDRQPIGIICHKAAFWQLGGRPAIYTDRDDPEAWPEEERYRIVRTDLARFPQPIDWMHEREWRIRGGLSLVQPDLQDIWWWPIVPDDEWVNYLWRTYPNLCSIYVMNRCSVVERIPSNVR